MAMAGPKDWDGAACRVAWMGLSGKGYIVSLRAGRGVSVQPEHTYLIFEDDAGPQSLLPPAHEGEVA